MISLLAVERMKLLSTRSPWWCMGVAAAVTVGLTTIFSFATTDPVADGVNSSYPQFFYGFGMVVMLVMATLAVTTEYRFGTIRTTFLAVPRRTRILLAKTAVVALLAGFVGEIAAIGSWGVAYLVMSEADLALNAAHEYRNTFGVGLIYLVAAVMAVAVGLLVRHSAGALSILFVWIFLIENLLPIIPRIGEPIADWLPFRVGDYFIAAGQPVTADGPPVPSDLPFGPWGSLAYFAAVAVGLLAAALVLARRRDA